MQYHAQQGHRVTRLINTFSNLITNLSHRSCYKSTHTQAMNRKERANNMHACNRNVIFLSGTGTRWLSLYSRYVYHHLTSPQQIERTVTLGKPSNLYSSGSFIAMSHDLTTDSRLRVLEERFEQERKERNEYRKDEMGWREGARKR